MIVRLLALILLLALAASAAASNGERDQAAARATLAGPSSAAAAPKPLHGVPLPGSTGLRLLIANAPPLLLNVDTGRVTRIGGLDVRGKPVLSLLTVGKNAIVQLQRRLPVRTFRDAEIYVVRRGTTLATRIASAAEVAPAADGAAVWLKSYTDARRCTLREVTLDGRERRSPRPIPCSTQLIDAAGSALLVNGSSIVDPESGRIVARSGEAWVKAGRFVLTIADSQGPLTLTDVSSGQRWRLDYPSQIGGQGGRDEAAVRREGTLVALSFSDPAYELSAAQATDVWLLDLDTRRFQQLPDMPAFVSLKSTSMSWTAGGQLVFLAETENRTVVAVWRPGQSRIAVRPVRLPARNSGSDSFVVWR